MTEDQKRILERQYREDEAGPTWAYVRWLERLVRQQKKGIELYIKIVNMAEKHINEELQCPDTLTEFPLQNVSKKVIRSWQKILNRKR